MDKVMVTIAGLLSIGGIYMFFFGKKDEKADAKTTWNILVEGGYKPGTIAIPIGKQSIITFTRKDANSCLEEVVIPDLKVKKYLPLNEPVAVTITPKTTGSFAMHCGMNMFHGKITVV